MDRPEPSYVILHLVIGIPLGLWLAHVIVKWLAI